MLITSLVITYYHICKDLFRNRLRKPKLRIFVLSALESILSDFRPSRYLDTYLNKTLRTRQTSPVEIDINNFKEL